jgi:hypothetical protein
MTTKTQADYDRLLLDAAHDDGLAWIDNLIAQHQSVVRDLERARARYVEVVEKSDAFATPVQVLAGPSTR